MQLAEGLGSLLLQVIVVEDENGNVVRETMKDTGKPVFPPSVTCLGACVLSVMGCAGWFCQEVNRHVVMSVPV